VVQVSETVWKEGYLVYWVMISEKSLVVIHSTFWSRGSWGTGISTGRRTVK
jgi:hypothetical protein